MKIVIGGNPPETDVSKVPNKLRPMPDLPKNRTSLPTRTFTLERSGTAGGGSRLSDEYWSRQKSLEAAVTEARKRLDELRTSAR